MKIIIYGAGDYAKRLYERLGNIEEVDIICFCESKKTAHNFCGFDVIEADELKSYDCDFVVIAIYADDEVFEYLKTLPDYSSIKDKLIRWDVFLDMATRKYNVKKSELGLCELPSNIKYLYDSGDKGIGQKMFLTNENFAKKEIECFFDLTDKYYGKKERTGMFFDIGANIGTTCIYVKKVLNPNIHIVAFEPGNRNHMLLKYNMMINGIGDAEVYKMGLGNEKCNASYRYCSENSGGSSIDANGSEFVEISTIDSFVSDNGIDLSSIDYIWIDTEGFEVKVILGASKCILERKIPLFQEFNARSYDDYLVGEYIKLMNSSYEGFVDVSCLREYPISALEDFYKSKLSDGMQTDLFFFD